MMEFDRDYAARLLRRLESIPEDAAPRWGTLRKDTLIEHLVWSLKHAMGRSSKVPYFGNAFFRWVVRPLALSGYMPIKKNLGLPKYLTAQGIEGREPGDLETLQALLEEYLELVQAGELTPAYHPVFGPLSVDEWARAHVLHFEHHCKQFNV